MRRLSLIAFGWMIACGAPAKPRPVDDNTIIPIDTPPKFRPAPPPPTLRLGKDVAPNDYVARLAIDPASTTFDGTIEIGFSPMATIGGLWLNAADLEIGSITLVGDGIPKPIPASLIPTTPATTEAEVVGIQFPHEIEPGLYRLKIAYKGKIYDNELDGIHRQQEKGEWYVVTQFEATDARRAFPCFDEPTYKVPFQLQLDVKAEHLAFANTPGRDEPASNGRKTVTFGTTKPLPTYLIAFAVGPFEIVDGGKAGKNHTPLRVIVPKGRTADAAYATKVTPELLVALEDYFGMPYPYEKLDQIAVPRKNGAMENAGLITYAQSLLVWPPDEDTTAKRRRFATTAAHELGHQWFGDLVTLAWWNDIWLNESFASWISDTVIQAWEPSWQMDVSRVSGRSGTMRGDTLKSSRKIRQPIETKADINTAFDGITYGKGDAVLTMVEAWIGADKFRTGVQKYLAQHAHGIATTEDFLAALSNEGGPEVTKVLSSFLDQTGVPVIGVELQCAKDRAPTLALTQQRYTTIGQEPTTQTWNVPVCMKFDGGRACTVLTQATGTLELPTKTCPAWVLANEGHGYYRVDYKGDLLAKLMAAKLSLAERIGVYGDLAALVDANKLPIETILELAPKLATEQARQLVSTATSFAGYLDDDYTAKALRPNRARFIRKLFGERARKIGFAAVKGESDDVRMLRSSLISWVALTGEDPQLIATAKRLALKWLTDKSAIDPDMVGTVLGIAARFGDRAMFDKLHAAAKQAKDRRERTQLLGAMGDFRDPAIVKAAMAIALTDEFPAHESIGLVWGALDEDNGDLAYAFIKQHHDELIAKLPRDYSFARAAGAFCDATHKADAEAFFKDKIAKSAGGPRSFAQTLERVDLCIARKQVFAPGIAKFLAKY